MASRAFTTLALALALLPTLMSHASTTDAILVWKVGSPHTGDTPHRKVPPALRDASARLGRRLIVEAFPAKGFAATFLDAVTRSAAPDLIVFDNFGVMDGATTPLGTFDGIGRAPEIRRHLIRVTGAFDQLLGPERGWTYLFSTSANHQAARTLALSAPGCPNGSAGPAGDGELRAIVPTLAASYLEGQTVAMQTSADPERLSSLDSPLETLSVGAVQACGIWGHDRLAFAFVNASYDAETTIGHTPLLLVLRKTSSQWQLLVAARDPISTGEFVKDVPTLTRLLTKADHPSALAAPATLLSPKTGSAPRSSPGERFGAFRWRSSPTDTVVAEIVEFSYRNDARLFLRRSVRPGSRAEISAGQLWTTRSLWSWRVWSITASGDVVFSDTWTFPH